jgi:hypothetical protein
MSTFQAPEVTATTDASGYFTYSFANNIDKAVAGPNQPQSGSGAGIIGASVVVTGAKSVNVRCWEADGSGGVRTCQSKQVTVTLLGITG